MTNLQSTLAQLEAEQYHHIRQIAYAIAGNDSDGLSLYSAYLDVERSGPHSEMMAECARPFLTAALSLQRLIADLSDIDDDSRKEDYAEIQPTA